MKYSKKSRQIFVSKEAKIEKGAILHNNVRILGQSVIKSGAEIFPGCEIIDSIIEEGASVKCSFLEGAKIGKNNRIGPFSRIRPNTQTAQNVIIGSFVEVKNSFIDEGTKASHLAYIGDAFVGKNVNVGCGAIFVNYNGKIKQKSVVEDGAFIGSNCNLIAPVHIKKGAYICAGTTITNDVDESDFVIGRVRQEHKKGLADKYLKND